MALHKLQAPLRKSLPASKITIALSADNNIYPSPLTVSTLQSWANICPAFFLQYVHPLNQSEIVGICIAIPILAPYWDDLIAGRIREWEVRPEMLYSRDRVREPVQVGLHVWHVERFSSWDRAWGGFGRLAWKDIEAVMEREGIETQAGSDSGVLMKGYSALAVTEDGLRLFRDNLGWERSKEYAGQWVTEDIKMKRRIVEKSEWSQEAEGYRIIGDCHMLVKVKGDKN
ncbi:hypothetical protein BDZ91DRAFT_715112, partial [Kalaharituber pfeilii]